MVVTFSHKSCDTESHFNSNTHREPFGPFFQPTDMQRGQWMGEKEGGNPVVCHADQPQPK